MDYFQSGLVLSISATLLVAVGCEDDGPVGDDDTIAEPDTSPCADGFRQDSDLPAEFLDEFPDGCVPQECGLGRWGNLEVDGETVYVDANAAEGGDGSEQAPFTSIQDGLDAAGETGGGMVAVAVGTYVENLLLTEEHDGVHLAGRCRDLVVLDASEGEEDESGIMANGFWGDEEWRVSGLEVTGAPYGGIWLQIGNLHTTSGRLVENHLAGFLATRHSSAALLSDVEIRDTQPLPDGTLGRGIQVSGGASLEADGCLVEGNSDVGILVSDEGTSVDLTDVEVRETQPLPNGTFGLGIQVSGGASLEADGCLVEGNSDVGIYVSGEGTAVLLSDVEVRETQPLPGGTDGRGIGVQKGAILAADGCTVEGNYEVGILVLDEGTVHLSDVEVRNTHRSSLYTVAVGVCSQEYASLIANELIVADTEGVGLFATWYGGLSCSNCNLTDSSFAGALAWSSGAIDLSTTNISGTRSDANEGGGIGIYASDRTNPPSLMLDTVTIQDQPYAALWLGGDGSFSITNSTLVGGYGYERTYPDGTSSIFHGDGVVATGGVSAWDGSQGLLLEGNEIRDAFRAGVLLDGSSAELVENTFTGNTTDVIWQDCDGVDEPVGLSHVPVVDHCPVYNHHIAPLEFNLHLEEVAPLDRERSARSTAAPDPLFPMPIRPSLPLLESLPMIPASTSRPLPMAPLHYIEPLLPSEPWPAVPSRKQNPQGPS